MDRISGVRQRLARSVVCCEVHGDRRVVWIGREHDDWNAHRDRIFAVSDSASERLSVCDLPTVGADRCDRSVAGDVGRRRVSGNRDRRFHHLAVSDHHERDRWVAGNSRRLARVLRTQQSNALASAHSTAIAQCVATDFDRHQNLERDGGAWRDDRGVLRRQLYAGTQRARSRYI